MRLFLKLLGGLSSGRESSMKRLNSAIHSGELNLYFISTGMTTENKSQIMPSQVSTILHYGYADVAIHRA